METATCLIMATAAAAAMPMNPTGTPIADRRTLSRGVGMARTGNLAGAKAEIAG